MNFNYLNNRFQLDQWNNASVIYGANFLYCGCYKHIRRIRTYSVNNFTKNKFHKSFTIVLPIRISIRSDYYKIECQECHLELKGISLREYILESLNFFRIKSFLELTIIFGKEVSDVSLLSLSPSFFYSEIKDICLRNNQQITILIDSHSQRKKGSVRFAELIYMHDENETLYLKCTKDNMTYDYCTDSDMPLGDFLRLSHNKSEISKLISSKRFIRKSNLDHRFHNYNFNSKCYDIYHNNHQKDQSILSPKVNNSKLIESLKGICSIKFHLIAYLIHGLLPVRSNIYFSESLRVEHILDSSISLLDVETLLHEGAGTCDINSIVSYVSIELARKIDNNINLFPEIVITTQNLIHSYSDHAVCLVYDMQNALKSVRNNQSVYASEIFLHNDCKSYIVDPWLLYGGELTTEQSLKDYFLRASCVDNVLHDNKHKYTYNVNSFSKWNVSTKDRRFLKLKNDIKTVNISSLEKNYPFLFFLSTVVSCIVKLDVHSASQLFVSYNELILGQMRVLFKKYNNKFDKQLYPKFNNLLIEDFIFQNSEITSDESGPKKMPKNDIKIKREHAVLSENVNKPKIFPSLAQRGNYLCANSLYCKK